MWCFQEGVNPKDLDQMTKKMGFPVGSTTLVDEVGVDVGMHVGNFMAESFGPRYGFTTGDVSMLDDMVKKGFLGKYITHHTFSSYNCHTLGGDKVSANPHKPLTINWPSAITRLTALVT